MSINSENISYQRDLTELLILYATHTQNSQIKLQLLLTNYTLISHSSTDYSLFKCNGVKKLQDNYWTVQLKL